MAAAPSISAEAETIATAAATTRHHPRAGASFLSFSFRPTARFVAASASASPSPSPSRRCKAKAREDDDKLKASAPAIDDQLVLDVAAPTWDDHVLASCDSSLVLVEFWAPWCGPCRLMHPVITDVAKAYAGRLRCFRLNTDENQDVATRYGIRSIPTILIFSNGERKETVIGAVTDTTLATTVERFL